MVFADVSGFTRLSERLARRGTEGAEQLVDVINACFSALLAEAYGRGGSLVKFGGDAMLLMFYDQEENQEHAARASSAAAAIRRVLREVGRIRTGDANVVLRMSVGVHSGAYGMFVVGGSHREVLIGGPAASAVVALEASAGAGQILISPETAGLLPRGCVGGAVGSGFLLARAPTHREWVPPARLPAPPQEVVAGFLPPAVRAQLLSGSAVPQHRTAAIAFLQFDGLDEVFALDGPEGAAHRLDELVRLVQDACERYEVCFLDSDIAADGGKIRLGAGVPRVVGDDEERMLLALQHITEGGPSLSVRMGGHRGPVFTGSVGPAYRRWYAVMGDTVNLAARLVDKAPAGRIYATQKLLRATTTRFRQTPLQPFIVKGKSRRVEAADVGPPIHSTGGELSRAQPPLTGRHRELEQLRAAVESARRGNGTLIELVGETGSGKSRLLREARELARGMNVLRATCEVYSRETPYAVWRDLLLQLLDLGWDDPPEVVLTRLEEEIAFLDRDLLPWLGLIAIVLDVPAPPSREMQQLAKGSTSAKLREVVVRFLGRALVIPTLVEIEHVHLMDAASVALFEALAGEVESSSWLVLATRRDIAGGLALTGPPPGRIELGPLSPEDARALAMATNEATQLPPHVVDLAVERSGGSPEFLLDLLAAAAAGDRDELPDNVGAATMARIDALDPGDGAILRRASVLGLTFDPRQLTDVLAEDESVPDQDFWDRLSHVFAREPSGHVRFRRPAVQEAAYASLPFRLRRELHAAVGLRLERDQMREPEADPALLSRHFALAGDHVRAHRYAMIAARRATERFAHADAAQLYRRAIDTGRAGGLAPDAPALAEAWEQLGDALRLTGELHAASRALTEARHLFDEPIAQARLCGSQAEVAERCEALTAAVRWLKRGLRYIDGLRTTGARIARARLLSHLGGVRNRQGRWSEAVAVFEQAIAEAESVGELAALARACYGLDWALVELGAPTDPTHSWRALEIYDQLGDFEHEAIVLNNLGMFAYFDGRWDEAIGLYRKAGDASERAGVPTDIAYTDCNVGEILSDQGRLDEAAAHLNRARRMWLATGELPSVAFVDLLLARVAVRRGGSQVEVATLRAATDELGKFGVDAYAMFAQALVAEAEAFIGDPSRALQIAGEHRDHADQYRPLLERMSGVALLRLGLRDAAEAQLARALHAARDRSADYEIAATIDVLDAIDLADDELRRERDEILARLKVERLPTPAMALAKV
jgi:class 3 adenylate cyclase/tetratricopeptide (TPR) repeat protein